MQYQVIKKFSNSLLMTVFLLSFMTTSHAHDGGATMDLANKFRTFTGVVVVTCFDDGGGPANHLIAQIRDESPPVPGLLVNLQIFKGNKAVSITDTISGDGLYSPEITLQGGPGTYFMIINKTDVGAREFDVIWHCEAADGTHTGTETSVSQFGPDELGQ